MQAMAHNLMVLDGRFMPARHRAELRLAAWPSLLAFSPAIRPVLMGSLRVGMGAGVGAGFGAAAGHFGIWVAAGMALGVALNALAPKHSDQRGEAVAPAPGTYRIH